MLLMTMSMVANAKDYGFKIGVVDITSDNYQSYKIIGYDYDPEKNVLHITSISQSFNIVVDGDVNRNLNLSIDADISVSSQSYQNSILYKWLRFNGSGNHVISGTGSLSLTSSVPRANMYNNPFYIGTAHVTIKDITLNIIAYGGCAFDMKSGGSLTFYHSAVTVKTADGKAVKSENGSSLSLKYCKLQEGQIDSGYRFVDSNGKDMDHIDIEQTEGRIPVDVFNVTVQEPVIGQTVGGIGATVDCSQYCYPEVKWRKNTGPNSFEYLSNSDIFEVGYAYSAQVTLHPRNSYVFSEDPDFDIIANGQSIPYYWTSYDVVFIITFPKLEIFYDLWVGDQQVKESNRNAIPIYSGTCNYDPDTKTLTLKSAEISNTDYNTAGTTDGYGIYSNIDGLTINLEGNNYIGSTHWVGLFSMNNLTITGNGKLFIEANNGNTGLAMGSNGYLLNIKGGADVRAYGGYGITGGIKTATVGGEEVIESYVTKLTVSGANTELHAYGTQQCVKDIPFLCDGMEYICEDNNSLKLYFKNRSICYYERRYIPYSGGWITLFNPGGITTGLSEASPLENGQGESVKGQRDERYNLSGQRVGKDYKGIVIHNGKKAVVN